MFCDIILKWIIKEIDNMLKPLQYAGCYSLDLYCDNPNDQYEWKHIHSETFTGESFTECVRKAKSKGWLIRTKNRTARCRICLNRVKHES